MDIKTKIEKLLNKKENLHNGVIGAVEIINNHEKYCNKTACCNTNDCIECAICFVIDNYDVKDRKVANHE